MEWNGTKFQKCMKMTDEWEWEKRDYEKRGIYFFKLKAKMILEYQTMLTFSKYLLWTYHWEWYEKLKAYINHSVM